MTHLLQSISREIQKQAASGHHVKLSFQLGCSARQRQSIENPSHVRELPDARRFRRPGTSPLWGKCDCTPRMLVVVEERSRHRLSYAKSERTAKRHSSNVHCPSRSADS